MQVSTGPFLALEERYRQYDSAQIAILPIPYGGDRAADTTLAEAPAAVIAASAQLCRYDETLKFEPFRAGIATLVPPDLADMSPERMFDTVYGLCRRVLADGKFPVVIGGDHALSAGFCQALFERFPTLAVIQLDARPDLLDAGHENAITHSTVMARVREMTSSTLHLGISRLTTEEAEVIDRERIPLFTMTETRQNPSAVHAALECLTDPVYITIDVGVFARNVVRSAEPQEPGGCTWDEMMDLLAAICRRKKVVGFDVVGLSGAPAETDSAYAVALLIYRLLGLWQRYSLSSS